MSVWKIDKKICDLPMSWRGCCESSSPVQEKEEEGVGVHRGHHLRQYIGIGQDRSRVSINNEQDHPHQSIEPYSSTFNTGQYFSQGRSSNIFNNDQGDNLHRSWLYLHEEAVCPADCKPKSPRLQKIYFSTSYIRNISLISLIMTDMRMQDWGVFC